MKDHRDIINLWPSITEFAKDISVGYEAAKNMRYRNSIAPRHWDDVERAAKSRGIENVTKELLHTMYVAQDRK